jgi:biopolymer transport protein ExbD
MQLSSRRSKPVEMQMTSMIDVTFLLLIFFMISATFVHEEKELDPAVKVNRPSSSQSTAALEPAIIELVPGSGGAYVYKVGARELANDNELRDVLSEFGNKSDGAFLRVSDGAPFEMAAAGINAARKAGFRNVTYLPLGRPMPKGEDGK